MRYAVTLTPDDETFLVTVPDIPHTVTFGVDREDALECARDAIETALMGAMAAREESDAPGAWTRRHRPARAVRSQDRALSRHARGGRRQRRDVPTARRRAAAVDRLLALRHNLRLDQSERALAALGRSMPIVVNAA